jgi:hypothetical protein
MSKFFIFFYAFNFGVVLFMHIWSISRRRKVIPAAPPPAWLDSTVDSMTQHLHRTTAKSPRQCHRQHDSTLTSRNGLIININNIWLQRQTDTLPAHTGTTHHYVWFKGWCKRTDALLGTSVKHLRFEDSRLKILSSRQSS